MYKRKYYLEKIQQTFNDKERILFLVWGRQVGKTTLLKSLIEFGLIPQEKSFFLNWDELFEEFQNAEQFLEYLKIKYGFDMENIEYFIIDEFHFIKNIWLILKNLIDGIRLKKYNFKLICSGSGSWYSFLWKNDALTGRYEVLKVYPFTFGEFLDFKWFKYYDISLENITLFADDLLAYFKEYQLFWGYPKVVTTKDSLQKKQILAEIFDSYLTKDVWFFLKWDEIFNFKRFLKLLVENIGSLVSVDVLVQKMWLGRYIVEKFLFIFNNTFIWKELGGLKTGFVEWEVVKKRKIYFYDLGLLNYLWDFTFDKGKIIENFVFTQIMPYLKNFEQIFYRRRRTGAEIDFVISDKIEKKVSLIEVKSGNKDNIPKAILNFLKFKKIDFDKIIITTEKLYKTRQENNKTIVFVPYVGVEKVFSN